jgi:hypothetical protein
MIRGLCERALVRAWRRCALLAIVFACVVVLGKTERAFASVFDYPVPVLRIAGGPAIHVTPEATSGTFGAFDVTAGVSWRFPSEQFGLMVGAEIGYGYDAAGLDAFQVLLALGCGTPEVSVVYQPRLLVGEDHGTAIGMRNGVAVRLFWDILSVEIAHRFTTDTLGTFESIDATIGLNVGALIYLPVVFASSFRWH